MTISNTGLNQIKKHEGLRLHAYLDPVGIPTIGYGNTYYENGDKVKMGEFITIERAEQLLRFFIDKKFSPAIDSMVKPELNQSQFDALISFAYNVGLGALSNSTLLKKVNANPSDNSIRQEFLKWNKAGGQVWKGLTKRREEEADMYFEVTER